MQKPSISRSDASFPYPLEHGTDVSADGDISSPSSACANPRGFPRGSRRMPVSLPRPHTHRRVLADMPERSFQRLDVNVMRE